MHSNSLFSKDFKFWYNRQHTWICRGVGLNCGSAQSLCPLCFLLPSPGSVRIPAPSTLSLRPLCFSTRGKLGNSVPEYKASYLRTQQTSLIVWYTVVSRSGVSFVNRTMTTACTRHLLWLCLCELVRHHNINDWSTTYRIMLWHLKNA
jgi:hypothetical protein